MKVLKNLLKRLRHFWLKKLESKYSNRYYKTIEDLPVLNWWKLHEENDFKWLLISPKKKVNRYASKTLKALKRDFTNEFGIDKKYEDYLNKIIKLTLINIDIAKSKDKSKKIFADIVELEIQDLLSDSEKKTVKDRGLGIVSKHLGTNIRIKEISVYEFYNHIRNIEQYSK